MTRRKRRKIRARIEVRRNGDEKIFLHRLIDKKRKQRDRSRVLIQVIILLVPSSKQEDLYFTVRYYSPSTNTFSMLDAADKE